MEGLYHFGSIMKRLKNFFDPYLETLSKPNARKLYMLIIAMIAVQDIRSINFLYTWFMGKYGVMSLNSYYHLLRGTRISLEKFMRITIVTALSIIPKELKNQCIFLVLDDTLQEKKGLHFESAKKLFDHSRHNGSNYLNGHCFVGLMIKIPVWKDFGNKIHYLCIPVGYRLKVGDESKLRIAAEMINNIMPCLSKAGQVILLCDSWYPKGEVLKTVQSYANLELIGNVRVDTVIYDLPPERTGKRGAPRKKGARLSIFEDFELTAAGDYFIGARRVITNLFSEPIYVVVSALDIQKHKTYRVFISTVLPSDIRMNCAKQENKNINKLNSDELWLLPFYIYKFRWSIEILFYEQKKFWGFGKYMLRSAVGIENYTNIISLVYAAMQMLPYIDSGFSNLKKESPQNTKYMISEALRCELFFACFAGRCETPFNSEEFYDIFDSIFDFEEPDFEEVS